LVMCPRGNHNNLDESPHGFNTSQISVLMGLRLRSSLMCSINMRGGTRGTIHTDTPPH
jgi:hypothetical protein